MDINAEMLRPEIMVTVNGEDITEWVAKFHVVSDLRHTADTVKMCLSDLTAELGPKIKRGDPIKIEWGWNDGEALYEIFRGVVRDHNGNTDPLTIRGIDYSTVLNSGKIQRTDTYTDTTAEDILEDLLAEVGMDADIQASGINIKRFPPNSQTYQKAIESITDIVNKQSEDLYYNYVRKGKFYWGKRDKAKTPAQNYSSAENVISFNRSESSLSTLKAFVSPVSHSDVVTVDNEPFFVMRAEYEWKDGGRVILGLLETEGDWTNLGRQLLDLGLIL